MLDNFFQPLLRTLRYIHVMLRGTIFCLFILILGNALVVTFYTVQGDSMVPTLHGGSVLVINRLAYLRSSPSVGDIVVVRYGINDEITFVKRVIAVEGQIGILASGAQININTGQIFIEGDNKNFSTDSRSYGAIAVSQVVGKVIGNF